MPNFSFLSSSNILVRGGVGGVGGFTVIIMQVSVQIGLNLTGLELGKIRGFDTIEINLVGI